MLSQDQQHAIVQGILDREGGLVDHPSDPGGLTNFGISQRSYPDTDIRALTRADAADIYLRDYLRRHSIHLMTNPTNAELMCDWLVNSGATAIRSVQHTLRLSVDGILGPKTRTAVDAMSTKDLLHARLNFYLGLVAHPFLKGWVHRLYQLGL